MPRNLIGKIYSLALHPSRMAEAFQYVVRRRIFPKDSEAKRIASWWHGNLPRVRLSEIFPGIEEISVNLKRTYDRTIGTSVDILELVTLVTIAKFIQARRVLEIGTFDGNTALNLAANSPNDALVVTVDLPEDWTGGFQIEVPTDHQNVTDRKVTGRQYLKTPEQSKIVQVLGDSAKLDWSQMHGPFDLAFIDGCHSYEYATLDTKNVLPQMRPGGVVVWHDYGQIPEVSRAVDEAAGLKSIHVVRGTRLAVGLM